jgi:hypothetical protein
MELTTLAFLQFLLLLLGTGGFILMLILLVIALMQAAPAMSAREWASANGLIIKAFVSSVADEENPKRAKLWYVPHVSYTYFADGVQYVAQRIHFGAPAKSAERANAEKALTPYPVGSTVTVFYNPDAPSSAVLRREAPNANKLMWLAFLIFLLALFFCGAAFWMVTWVR